jgi:hypothetical protein
MGPGSLSFGVIVHTTELIIVSGLHPGFWEAQVEYFLPEMLGTSLLHFGILLDSRYFHIHNEIALG